MRVTVRLFAFLRERAGAGTFELDLDEQATVASAISALNARGLLPSGLLDATVATAVNKELVPGDTPLHPEDELALIPPVSGGEAGLAPHVRVTEEALQIDALADAVRSPLAGALVIFCGVTREVAQLEYEAYREMAQAQIVTIASACAERPGIEAVAIEHRLGVVPLGEPSVIVAVSAAHREEAFHAAKDAIDHVKAQAPIWKREVEASGAARWAQGTPLATLGQERPAAAAQVAPAEASASAQDSAPAIANGARLTHIADDGSARMVDVGAKPITERRAKAKTTVRMSPATAAAVAAGDAPKGDVLSTARLAGIQGAKQTGGLIPLAHPIELTFIDVQASIEPHAGLVTLVSEVHTSGRTGVEMEAMTACTIAALTVYDMVKGLERGVEIGEVALLEKSGGRSGTWRRAAAGADLRPAGAQPQPAGREPRPAGREPQPADGGSR